MNCVCPTRRLKQKEGHKPTQGFDYSALAPLNNSLEELYLIGTPGFSSVFTEFHRLHTLSIGEYPKLMCLVSVNVHKCKLLYINNKHRILK